MHVTLSYLKPTPNFSWDTAFVLVSGSRDKQICLSECFSKGKKNHFPRKTLHLKPSFSHLKHWGCFLETRVEASSALLRSRNSPVSHNVQKDCELLTVVGDGNLKKNRNKTGTPRMSTSRQKQELPQGAGIERDKNLWFSSIINFFLCLTLDGCLEELNTA